MKNDQKNRKTARYAAFVAAVKKRDGHKCAICGAGDKLHVHHLIPYDLNESLQTDVSNGLTLCEKCHGAIHGRKFRSAD